MLNYKALDTDPWLKLTSLMLTDKSKIFWKTNINSEKKEIVNGFKELYQNNSNKEKIQHNKILELMIQDMQYIVLKQQCFNNIPTPYTPKSNAKDINGLSQKTIMKMINNKTKNIVEIANNFLKLLEKLKISQNSNIIIHTTSRIILKKKKENIENWTDLRSLNIMPAAIMVHDKILRSINNLNITP